MDANYPITIELARPEDAEGIQFVLYKTWLNTYPNEAAGITADDIEDRYKDKLSKEGIQRYRNRISKLPGNQRILVAKLNKNVIGVCNIIKHEFENELRAIYVLPEHQGKGVGKALWNESRRFFNPKNDVVIEVAVYNTRAINFYTKLGFTDTKKRFSDEKFKMKSGATIPEMEMRLPGNYLLQN